MTTVTTDLGPVRGAPATDRVTVFRAVPYAAPPVGALRFAPTAPATGWTGVRDATVPGPAAPQPPSRLERVMGPMRSAGRFAEDCLTVDVWTPGPAGDPRPVLMWLHGGGFSSGSGSAPWYDGTRLAERGDIVVVTVNYRLGALGFLACDGVAGGNMGLQDMAAALRWVARNATAFGGDPGRITVAGQSAGAISIAALLAVPELAGIVAGAIMQSAPLGMIPASAAEAGRVAELFLHELDLPQGQEQRLRDVPVERLLAAQVAVAAAGPPSVVPPLQFVADGPLAPARPGLGAGVPLLLGDTADEAAAFVPDAPRAVRAGIADPVFGPVWHLAAERAGPVFAYRFGRSLSPFGACHCLELPFVFGDPEPWRGAPMLGDLTDEQFAALTGEVQPAWLAFVRTGEPNGPGLPAWPRYDGTETTLRRFEHRP